jgi:hypothetical protein
MPTRNVTNAGSDMNINCVLIITESLLHLHFRQRGTEGAADQTRTDDPLVNSQISSKALLN